MQGYPSDLHFSHNEAGCTTVESDLLSDFSSWVCVMYWKWKWIIAITWIVLLFLLSAKKRNSIDVIASRWAIALIEMYANIFSTYLFVWINIDLACLTFLPHISPRIARHPFSITFGTLEFAKASSGTLVRGFLLHLNEQNTNWKRIQMRKQILF